MFSVRRELCAGAAVESVGSGGSFGQRIGAHDLTGSQPRQIFLLLFFRTKINNGQCADAGMPAPCRGKACILRNVIGDDGGGDFVHLKPAVSFGNFDRAEPKLSCLLQQFPGNREILVLNLLDVRHDLVDGKFFRCLPNKLVLLGKIFRRKDFLRTALFE